MRRIVLDLSFDGTNFNGWQIQKTGRTIQQVLENALSQMAKEKINITGSGRTDSGVHAIQQIAHFDYKGNMKPEQINLALHAILPDDIRVNKVIEVGNDFHARFDAFRRTYNYHIAKKRTPFNRLYKSWYPKIAFETDYLREACTYFLGEHDFSSFAKPNPDLKHYRCTLEKLELIETDDSYIFEISANRFLHNMVRRIVGCMLTLMHKRINPGKISEFLNNPQHNQVLVPTAQPQGLFLVKVEYPENSFNNEN